MLFCKFGEGGRVSKTRPTTTRKRLRKEASREIKNTYCLCFFAPAMPRERGGRKRLVWGAIFAQSRPTNAPKMRRKVEISGRSGRSISKISLIRSFRPVRPVGLVWSRRLGRPGGLGPIWCRVTAAHALVRGGPRRNDPPCPSRWVKAVPLVPLCILSLLRLVYFCLPSLWV